MLPNLLIIGAAKCGTTSLHYYLSLHPEVFMSTPKELNFWHWPDSADRVREYEKYFPSDAPVRGEGTVRYTYYPINPGTPERIAKVIPDAKLIYMVRDPVDRAIAHYVEERALGTEERTFEEALGNPEDPFNRYIAFSRYALQVERYLDSFPAANLLVLDQRELLSERDGTLQKVFRFIGVDDTFTSPDFNAMLNTTRQRRRMRALYGPVRQLPPVQALRKLPPHVRGPLFKPVHMVLSRKIPKPEISDERRQELAAVLADDVERFRTLTGKPFAHWRV